MIKTNFIVQREWLRYAEGAKKSADGWRKAAKNWTKENSFGWSKSECELEANTYTQKYEEMLDRAKTAPVKLVITYADGRTEVIE